MLNVVTPAPMNYDFFAPAQICFGWGRRREVGQLARRLGARAFVVCGSRTLERDGVLAEIAGLLRQAGVEIAETLMQTREPLVSDVDEAIAKLRRANGRAGDFLVALGGGSAIDLAKAAGALATNHAGDSIRDYLEGVGRGLTIETPPLPVLAMPTTGGTGTEATKNAVISSYDPPFKKSLRSPWLVPQVVLVDPELAVSVSPETTAYTGLDAITQLIESYVSRKAAPIPQALALQGLELAASALVDAVRNGTSRPARECMAHGALLSGLSLANAGLGVAHGVAAALGVHCQIPHGLACAIMLPEAIRLNLVVREAEFARIATALGVGGPTPAAAARAALAKVEELVAAVGIPQRLSAIGVLREQIPALVQSSHGTSLNGNPRDVPDDELQQSLEAMF